MKLHCMICSLQGTHKNKESEIATIDDSKLKLPLTPDMFTSVNPERETPAPWRPGTDWQSMYCPRGRKHLPWGIGHSDIRHAIDAGGPEQILTDKGMIDVPLDNPAELSAVQPVKLNVQIFTCEKCGRKIKSRIAFFNHQKACKGTG